MKNKNALGLEFKTNDQTPEEKKALHQVAQTVKKELTQQREHDGFKQTKGCQHCNPKYK